MKSELPDLFRFEDGCRVQSKRDWDRRRDELLDLILQIEYGRLPPAAVVQGEKLHSTQALSRFLNASYTQYRLITGTDRRFEFVLNLMIPAGTGPFPVVLTGDGCWRYVTDEITADVLRRGYILGVFNRVEMASDIYRSERISGLYRVYPEGDYGALTAWAWGYHRCVDFLVTQDFVDKDRIAIVGHSRGGKCALLAGATDPRIALTASNDSGCGGAGCFRHMGPGSETLADILRAVPYWFAPGLRDYIGREDSLPFDQHSLKALIAPRAQLSTEALGDLWGNPTGTWQTHRAAREAYHFLGVRDQLGICYREGEHSHKREDWTALLDFADWRLRGKPAERHFDSNPFPDLPAAYSWSAPQPAA